MRRFLPGFFFLGCMAGAIVVAGVAWFLWPERASGPAAPAAPIAPPPAQPVPKPPPKPKTPEEIAAAKVEARRILDTVDADDPEAHATLGHMEFEQPIPEAIAFMGYPFLRIVEEANEKRWFDDAKAYNRAMQARERTLQHAHRLETDRVYRCLDAAHANVDRDEYMKDYVYATYNASPYLICYTDGERISEADLDALSPVDRVKRLDAADAKRASWRKILAEKGRIFTQLYAEFLRRYGEVCDLKDLMAPYGGRPDYGIGRRSYADGCPLVVWIFSDKKAWRDYHEKVKREWIDDSVAGYFEPSTGWVFSHDESADERQLEIAKDLHAGTHQLVHWFRAQVNEWQTGLRVPPSWFSEGFAEYIGAVAMDNDRRLTFLGLNRPRLERNQEMSAEYRHQEGKDLQVIPLQDLVGLEGYGSLAQYCQEKYGKDRGRALQLFRCQSWALAYFLNEALDHKYQPRFNAFLADVLNGHDTISAFRRAFGMKSDADWAGLQQEFTPFFAELGRMDVTKIGSTPPALDDWPAYLPTDD